MIEAMERISLYGLKKDSDRVIATLMELGCMEIESPEESPLPQELAEVFDRRGQDAYDWEQLQARVGQAIQTLSPFGAKKSLFAQRPTIAFDEMIAGPFLDQARDLAARVEDLTREQNRLGGEISKAQFTQLSLEPWSPLDQPLDQLETLTSQVLLVVLPPEVTLDDLVEEAAQQQLGAYLSRVNIDDRQWYLAAVATRERMPQVWELLRQRGGVRTTFPGMTGTAQQNIARYREQIQDYQAEQASLQARLEALAPELDLLHKAYDALQMRLDCTGASGKLLESRETFFFQAWVPTRAKGHVEAGLGSYTCYYQFSHPGEEDEPPILLTNKKLVEPFESATEMYSLPLYRSVDPNFVMSIFYFIIFGMMLSDAGYGLILAIGGLWGAKKLDLGPGAKKMLTMLGYCGISTIFWGAAFGSWFGDLIPVLSQHLTGVAITPPMLMDPLAQPVTLLMLALVAGFFHLLAGMGMQAYVLARDGKPWDALMDVGSWYLVFFGLACLAVSMAGGSLAILADVGKWLTLAGVAALILTQGRSKKNIFMKLFGGVASLYNIIGYLSDMLSYSRIMALGLATGVISMVINLMATLPGRSIIGLLFFVVIFAFGHTLNFAINALGSYVHTSRLQYVEFFGKFYESGGRAFAPLTAKTKYYRVINREED